MYKFPDTTPLPEGGVPESGPQVVSEMVYNDEDPATFNVTLFEGEKARAFASSVGLGPISTTIFTWSI